MTQWISNQTKQQWQRILFSIGAAIFLWWYIHETLITTRVYTDVPIYIQGVPPGKTLPRLQKDGKLMGNFSLTLKGRKKSLDIIKSDQIEIIVNASGKGDIWKEEINVDSLRCLNPEVQVQRDITEVIHPPLQIRLTNKVSREVPLTVLPPIGNLPKGYRWIDIWPDKLSQSLEGPEESVQALMGHKLFLTFDLSRLTKQQLERSSEDLPPGSEIFFKVPESWKSIYLPAPFNEKRALTDPEAEQLMLVILKPALLSLENPIPVRISPLPIPLETSPVNNQVLSIAEDGKNILKRAGVPYWVTSVFVDGVSRSFLDVILPHLELVVYVGTKGNISALFEIANTPRAIEKYIQRMKQTHFEPSIDEEGLDQRLTKQFWYYFSQMSFYGQNRQRLIWDLTVDGELLHIKEGD